MHALFKSANCVIEVALNTLPMCITSAADTRRARTMGHPMKLIRYNALVEKGVVNSRMTLKRLIDTQDFPPGVLITPNARAWQEEEVDAWIAARPAARKPSTRKLNQTTSTQAA
jgi:predicted DNA-binding transcriptional regulator AlpA